MPAQANTPDLRAVDDTGKPVDLSVIEDSGMAFDPTTQHLDLTKDEKRRTTALMMAIQAYNNLIIKDAAMFVEVRNAARAGDGAQIKPATIDAMVEAAFKFDLFISGAFSDAQGIEAEGRDALAARGEAREPGPKDAPESDVPAREVAERGQ